VRFVYRAEVGVGEVGVAVWDLYDEAFWGACWIGFGKRRSVAGIGPRGGRALVVRRRKPPTRTAQVIICDGMVNRG